MPEAGAGDTAIVTAVINHLLPVRTQANQMRAKKKHGSSKTAVGANITPDQGSDADNVLAQVMAQFLSPNSAVDFGGRKEDREGDRDASQSPNDAANKGQIDRDDAKHDGETEDQGTAGDSPPDVD